MTSPKPPEVASGAKRPQRWLGLDVLRTLLVLAVVLLHVGIAYTPVTEWALHDRASIAVDLFVFLGNQCLMITFFVVSGFAGRGLLESRGARGFVEDRALRMALPLILLTPVVQWLLPHLWIWGGRETLAHVGGTVSPPRDFIAHYPFAHLWFLYLICIFYLAVLPLRQLLSSIAPGMDRLVAFAARWRIMPLLFGLPIALAMTLRTDWSPWMAIPIPFYWPNPLSFVGYGAPFVCGWLLHRQSDLLGVIAKGWWVMLIAAVLIFVADIALLIMRTRDMAMIGAGERAIYAGIYALNSWTLSMAMLSAALRFGQRPGPVLRYLSQTSYWTYLVHLPLTMVFPILLLPYGIDPTLKWAIASAASVAAILTSFELLARRTFIARWLNGSGRQSAVPTTAPVAKAA